jgi:hypothetical protein
VVVYIVGLLVIILMPYWQEGLLKVLVVIKLLKIIKVCDLMFLFSLLDVSVGVATKLC